MGYVQSFARTNGYDKLAGCNKVKENQKLRLAMVKSNIFKHSKDDPRPKIC